jgi:hypothetical protein
MGLDHEPARSSTAAGGPLRAVLWGVAALAGLALAGWLVGADGWPGEPSGCIAAGDCSCEAFSAGVVVQPVNTLSSLALAIAGIGLMWLAPSRAPDRRRRLAFAVTVLGLGIGAAALHASMTEWGGWMDLVGIHLFLGAVLVIDVAELAQRSERWTVGTIATSGVGLGVVLWFLDNRFGKYTAGALVVAIALAEWQIRKQNLRPARRCLWWAVGLFGAGLALQWLGRGGGPWCDPDRLLQPHAMWHVVAAIGAVALARYLFPRPGSEYHVPSAKYD